MWIPLINHCTAGYAIRFWTWHHCTRFDLVCWFESYPLWVCFNIKVSPIEIYKILKQFESWNRFCFSFILNTLLCASLKFCKSIFKCLSAASLKGQHFFFFFFHTFRFILLLLPFFFYIFIYHIFYPSQNCCTVDHRKYLLIGSLNLIRLGPLEPINLISTTSMLLLFLFFCFTGNWGLSRYSRSQIAITVFGVVTCLTSSHHIPSWTAQHPYNIILS